MVVRLFPARLSSAWSSGTGFAGVMGAAFYFIFDVLLNWPDEVVFFMLIPSIFLYLFTFELMKKSPINTDNLKNNQLYSKLQDITAEKLKHDNNDDDDDNSKNSSNTDKTDTNDIIDNINQQQSNSVTTTETKDTRDTIDIRGTVEISTCGRIWECYKLCYYPSITLMLVYFFEYVTYIGLGQIANTNLSVSKQDSDFVILDLMYQFGVFFSRTSVSCFVYDNFILLTTLQCVNFIFWHFQAKYTFLPEWAQFILMFYVGLLGGTMYVQVSYNILNDGYLKQAKRRNIKVNTKIANKELVLNIVFVHIVIGLLLSSAYMLFMDNTFFSGLIKHSG